MKRVSLALLLAFCLLLTGCQGKENEKRFFAFSDKLNRTDALSFTAELRAEYADRTLSFTLGYEKGSEGETVSVVKPEQIAGIRARRAAGKDTLEFEGLILDPGPLDPYGLTPMSALPSLVEALCSGHLDSHWEESGALVYRLILDDHVSASVWFEPESMTPHYAELQSDDTVRVFCTIDDWR